jgi:hypothetical protein
MAESGGGGGGGTTAAPLTRLALTAIAFAPAAPPGRTIDAFFAPRPRDGSAASSARSRGGSAAVVGGAASVSYKAGQLGQIQPTTIPRTPNRHREWKRATGCRAESNEIRVWDRANNIHVSEGW